VDSVRRVTDMIGEISTATDEQSAGLGAVNLSVNELDQMTQQNAALVEQSAAAAESLRAQATRLSQVVQVFQVSGRRLHLTRGGFVEHDQPTTSRAGVNSAPDLEDAADTRHRRAVGVTRPCAKTSERVCAAPGLRPAPRRPAAPARGSRSAG
jgi:methyl-accepting chemotaxis protein